MCEFTYLFVSLQAYSHCFYTRNFRKTSSLHCIYYTRYMYVTVCCSFFNTSVFRIHKDGFCLLFVTIRVRLGRALELNKQNDFLRAKSLC